MSQVGGGGVAFIPGLFFLFILTMFFFLNRVYVKALHIPPLSLNPSPGLFFDYLFEMGCPEPAAGFISFVCLFVCFPLLMHRAKQGRLSCHNSLLEAGLKRSVEMKLLSLRGG